MATSLQQTVFKGQLAQRPSGLAPAVVSRPQRGRLVINNASKVTGKIKLALVAGKVRSLLAAGDGSSSPAASKPQQDHQYNP